MTNELLIPFPQNCPFCSATITTVKQCTCQGCGTTFEGHFALPDTAHALARLNRGQLDFVLALVRCEGKLDRLTEMLGLPHAAVQNQLQEVISALSTEPSVEVERAVPPHPGEASPALIEEPADKPLNRKQILDHLAAGQLSPEEAMRLLRSLP